MKSDGQVFLSLTHFCWVSFGFLWLELCVAALMMLFVGVSSKLQVSVFVGFLWLELCLAALMMLFTGVSSKLQVSATT